MHRFTIVASLALTLLVGIVAAGFGTARAGAETAAPITVNELVPGVTAEVLTAAPSMAAPGRTVYVARFVFQPGAEMFPHGHPGTVVLGVQSGTFGWTLVAGTAHVVRGAGTGKTGPVEDVTIPGTEVILQPGDEIYYESDVMHTARGAGDEAAVVLGTLILPDGAPLLMRPDMPMAAPAR